MYVVCGVLFLSTCLLPLFALLSVVVLLDILGHDVGLRAGWRGGFANWVGAQLTVPIPITTRESR